MKQVGVYVEEDLTRGTKEKRAELRKYARQVREVSKKIVAFSGPDSVTGGGLQGLGGLGPLKVTTFS